MLMSGFADPLRLSFRSQERAVERRVGVRRKMAASDPKRTPSTDRRATRPVRILFGSDSHRPRVRPGVPSQAIPLTTQKVEAIGNNSAPDLR